MTYNMSKLTLEEKFKFDDMLSLFSRNIEPTCCSIISATSCRSCILVPISVACNAFAGYEGWNALLLFSVTPYFLCNELMS